MPIITDDINIKYSTKVGSAGNDNSGTANGSLGKYIATNEITSAVANNLFDDVSGQENIDEDVEYRCIFIHNSHASITYEDAGVYIVSQGSDGANIAIGVDPTAASAIDSSDPQALEIADEDTAPEDVVFTTPTDQASAISLGDIAPGFCKAFWVQRTATNSAAKEDDAAKLRVFGNTV